MRLLIIDDSPVDSLLIKRLAEREMSAGIVDCVSTLAFGIEKLQTASFDGIVCDVRRQDSLGPEIDLSQLRAVTSSPVIFVSGFAEEAERKAIIRAGAEGYLNKDAVTGRVLEELFLNAKYRRDAVKEPKQDNHDVLESLNYLSLTIEAAIFSAESTGNQQRLDWLGPFRDSLEAISEIAATESRDNHVVSTRRVYSIVERDLKKLASKRGVAFDVHGLDGNLVSHKSSLSLSLGLKFLLSAFILATSPGERIFFYCEKEPENVRLYAIVPTGCFDMSIFERQFEESRKDIWGMSEAQIALGLATKLLKINPSDVRRVSTVRNHTLSLNISDSVQEVERVIEGTDQTVSESSKHA